jgi:hypothetical protein
LKKGSNNKRSIAYEPNFNKIPAKITDPGVGASTWASGNQICKGITGILTENPKKKKIQIKNWRDSKKNEFKKTSKEEEPLLRKTVKMLKKINAEPSNV